LNAIDRLATFASRRTAPAVIALWAWAMAEAIVLPIVPDVGLALLALAAPRRTVALLGAVVVGAVIGSLVLVALVAGWPAEVQSLLLGLPGIDAGMLTDVDMRVANDGLVAFAQVGPGPPLKAYTEAWVAQGGDAGGVIIGTVINRITRIGPVVVVAAIAGTVAGSWIRDHARTTVVAYSAAWLVFYGIYLG
jgi:hypothetical protein